MEEYINRIRTNARIYFVYVYGRGKTDNNPFRHNLYISILQTQK